MLRILGLLAALIVATPGEEAKAVEIEDPENTLVIELENGPVHIAMRPDLAPQHVARIKELAREGFYDGIVFHRVIDGFMAQTGDPTGTGTGGSSKPDLPDEFTSTPFVRGSVGMAKTQAPNSANSQFFIMFADHPHLTGNYTLWGEVISGMEHVDAIKKGDSRTGQVQDPDRMIDVYVAADGPS